MRPAAWLLSPGGLSARVGQALNRSGAGWWVALIPTPWFLVNDCLGSLSPELGANGWKGVPGVVAQLLVIGWLAVPVFAWLRGRGRDHAWHAVVLYAACGVMRATMLAALVGPEGGFWSAWLWLMPSVVLGNLVWLSGAALLVHWAGRVRARRSELGKEYARLMGTRSRDARALAEADVELATVRTATHAALADIYERLSPQMSRQDLEATVELIDDVVAGLVRPTSHDLARMPEESTSAGAERLWMGRREVVPAVLRAWPVASPYQPLLVGLLCAPMVLAAELVPEPHLLGVSALIGTLGLLLQLALLTLARFMLAPRLRELPAPGAMGVVFASYVALAVVGLSTLSLALGVQPNSPLEAFVAPVLLTVISGGVAAAALAQAEEAAAARAVIRRTHWNLRRTRQRLWAQRRRLAMALHGRVQANLTAAALVLRNAGESMAAGASLDPAVVAQVRHTITLAGWIDQGPSGPPRDRFASIAAVWEGVLHVALEVRPRAEDVLEANRDAADACVEVVREILLNAVRHGGAVSADVVIGLDSATLICVRVAEHGTPPAPSAPSGPPGLGRSLIDSLAVDWAERDGADGRTTVVLLAGASAAPQVADAAARLDDVSDLS